MFYSWTTLLALWQVLVFSCCWNTCKGVECLNHPEPIKSINLSGVQISENPLLSSLPGHGPSEVSLTGAGWCSEKLLSVVDPYLQLDFDQQYAIYFVNISGANDSESYVTALQTETDILGNGEFHLIRPPANNLSGIVNTPLTGATDFKLVHLNSSTGFGSWSLRIRPYSWTMNPPCMRLEVFGCLPNPSTIDFPPTSSSNANTDRTALAVALPIAVSTILIVSAIAIISVTTCYCIYHKNERGMNISKKSMELNDDRTIKHVKNELYRSSERGYIEESTASSTRHMLREPQPYEEARPSISGMITSSDEYPAVNGSSSMSSTKYNYIKKERVKPYKTVSLESTETLGSESGDAGYSVVLNPPLEAAVSDVGYSVVQSPPSETGASDVGYSVVQSPTLEADATLSTEDGYLVVPSPNLTTDYLNVSSADHSLQERQLGISESCGPEQFEV